MTKDVIVNEGYRKIFLLREKGIEPFPRRFKTTHMAAQALLQPEGSRVIVAGRIVLMRVMGKASFAHVKDSTGRIQIYVKRDNIGGENYEVFRKLLNVGDFVGGEGELFVTRTGEKTINGKRLVVLSNSVRPKPEKWRGLTDPELRYRERYLDIVSNDEVRNIFIVRSRIIAAMRQVLDGRGYFEVETPILCSQAGGASARPFFTYHNVYKKELALRIATELYLKKLIIGGFDGVYEIGRVFRNEGIDTRHNPEFTMLEAYKAYADYNDMADLLEDIFSACCRVLNIESVIYYGKKVNLKVPYRRIYLPDEWKSECKEDIHEVLKGKSFDREKLEKLALRLNVEYSRDLPSAKIFERIFEHKILRKFNEPVFVRDYPTAITPLAKCKEGDEALVERFEFFAGGEEIANAYTELNDPQDQKERLQEQMRQRNEERNQETDILDKDFIEAMEYGMPPTGGIGIGIDRMTMLLTGKSSIREVILFPLLKPTTSDEI